MRNELTHYVQNFFQSHLPVERGLRPHTIMAYRDTVKLFLQYLSKSKRRVVRTLSLNDVSAKTVLSFLEDSERVRGNSPKTRNQRLAVLKSFFTYLINVDPTRADQYEKVFHLRAKRVPYRPVEYLFKEEFNAIMNEIDLQTEKGRRDYAALLFLYNTGARAQELCDMRVVDLRLEKPTLAMLNGKGNKTRHVPLWRETVEAIKAIAGLADAAKDDPVFKNKQGGKLTRFGIRYLLRHYVARAAVKMPELKKKKIGPHTIRHTTAMHLLQSGVDITIIKSWLGHVDLNTTHGYIEIDLKMKEEALLKNKSKLKNKTVREIVGKEKDLIAWLESFGDM